MVTFYDLSSSGTPTKPVLYLDTLKVSTIEQTAETSDAKGGKGNATLISWDYGKEITVTLEDALFSAKSMAIMFGNGTTKEVSTVSDINYSDVNGKRVIMKTEQFVAESSGQITVNTSSYPQADQRGWSGKYEAPNGERYIKYNPKFYSAAGEPVTGVEEGKTYFCTYDIEIKGATIIEISANSFPGTYYVTGDTFARAEKSGKDEFFQFIIPKAKVTSENTITLEAEGDPSVFNMNLKVLRPTDGVMMKLVKYDLDNGEEVQGASTAKLIHNHELVEEVDSAITVTLNGSRQGTINTTTIGNTSIDEYSQYIFDTDVIESISCTEGVLTITGVTGVTNGATSAIKFYDKDGNLIDKCTIKIAT